MKPDERRALSEQSHQLGLDIERHMRQERLNGHLSPTDSAVLQRISTFLLKTLPVALKDPRPETDNRTRQD